ncbi:MAG: hypothetical protein R3D55_17180 [Chloroflexota bacterium]
MSTNGANSNQNLLKMKVALAAGGLITTLIGAELLGNQAGQTAVSTTVTTSTTLDEAASGAAITLPELDLELEAIPTVAAPSVTISSRPIASSRSSG